MDKYVLAVRLARAFGSQTEGGLQDQGLIEVKIIEDNDFAPLLLSSKAHLQKYESVRPAGNKKSG